MNFICNLFSIEVDLKKKKKKVYHPLLHSLLTHPFAIYPIYFAWNSHPLNSLKVFVCESVLTLVSIFNKTCLTLFSLSQSPWTPHIIILL